VQDPSLSGSHSLPFSRPPLRAHPGTRQSPEPGERGERRCPSSRARGEGLAGHIGHTTSINWLQLMSGEV